MTLNEPNLLPADVKKRELTVQRHEVRIAADSPMRLESKLVTFRPDQHDSDDLKPFSSLVQCRIAHAHSALRSVYSRLICKRDNALDMEIYKNPAYYEIAFSFFDVKKQVDTFELVIKEFSKIKVKRFLDVACGPSLQLRELARRGYEAVGLDSSRQMLRYLSEKAKEEGLRIETVQADMCSFRLTKKVDFAFIMMGSLVVESNERFIEHLDSVACSLKRGGLYFIQNKIADWTRNAEQSWIMEREGVSVKTTYSFAYWKDMLNQIYTEKGMLEVNDQGQTKRLVSEEDLKLIFPQEFKALIKLQNRFEFLGWWEGDESTWFLDKPLEKAETLSNINMVLLRKR